MPHAVGLSAARLKRAIPFAVLLVAFVLAYHQLIQRSIRSHPEVTLRTVQEHCRYMLGKRVGKTPPAELSDQLQRCASIRVKSVEVAGGVFDPVFVRVTIEPQSPPLLGTDVFIFRAEEVGWGDFTFLSGLCSLVNGRWAFDVHHTYGQTTFRGSF
jgi:hypothetical protein